MKNLSSIKINPFHREFWINKFLPDNDVISAYFSFMILFSCVIFLLYDKFFKDYPFVLVCLFVIILIIGSFIWYRVSRNKKIDSINNIDLSQCKNCVTNMDNDSFFLSQYQLIKFKKSPENSLQQDSLQSIEESLSDGDKVIIYTSSQDTEKEAIETVRANRKKGVIYQIIYYCPGNFDSEEDKKLYTDPVKLSQSDSNIDSQLAFHGTGFDLFCFQKPDKSVKAYFAVNYSVREAGVVSCIHAINGDCDDPCNIDNKYLFYKIIDNDIASGLYSELVKIIAKENKKGKK